MSSFSAKFPASSTFSLSIFATLSRFRCVGLYPVVYYPRALQGVVL